MASEKKLDVDLTSDLLINKDAESTAEFEEILEGPKKGTLQWAEQIDPVFAFWKAHHEDARKAYLAKDYDLAHRLNRETLADPAMVPILYRAEAHMMLSYYLTIPDFVDQARQAKEQYRRLYQKYPDSPACKRLWIKSHNLVRKAEKRAGHEQLSAEYVESEEDNSATTDRDDHQSAGFSPHGQLEESSGHGVGIEDGSVVPQAPKTSSAETKE